MILKSQNKTTMSRKKRIYRFNHFRLVPIMAALTIWLAFGALPGYAQSGDSQDDVFVLTTLDEQAYIYNMGITGFSGGFHVERRQAGNDWQRITEEPVFPASDGVEFERMVGDLFPMLQEMTEQQDPHDVYLRMMTRQQAGFVGSLIYPDVARALGRLFVDENPPVSAETEYRIVFTNSRGEPTGEMVTTTVTLEPQLPETPENLSVSYEGAELTITWDYPVTEVTEDGVAHFRIYFRDAQTEELLTREGVLRRTDTESQRRQLEVDELNREYEIYVVAADAAGQESGPTEPVSVIPEDNIPPEPVLNINLHRLDDETIEISWPVSPDPDAAGYHVYRFEQDADENFVRITDQQLELTENVYRDTTITGSSHYNYTIRVLDEHGNESEPSNEASMLIEEFEPPEPVTEVEARLQEGSTVYINWDESPAEDISSYSVIRREVYPEFDENYSQVNEGRLMETDIIDQGIAGAGFPEGRTFEFGVVAVGSGSMHSDTVSTELHIPLTTPPEPPANIEVNTAEAERVNIRWGASSSRTVTHYNIYRLPGQDDSDIPEKGEDLKEGFDDHKIKKEDAGTHFTRDEHAETGQTYRYLVAAIDSAGNLSTPKVSELLDHRSARPPQPVRNLQAREVDDEVLLRWEPVNSEDLEGYKIYRSSIATGAFEVINEVDKEHTEWADPDGEPGKWYQVRAIDTSGNESRTTRATQAVQ